MLDEFVKLASIWTILVWEWQGRFQMVANVFELAHPDFEQ